MVALTAVMLAFAGTMRLDRLPGDGAAHSPVLQVGERYGIHVDPGDVPRYLEGPDGRYVLLSLRLTVLDVPEHERAQPRSHPTHALRGVTASSVRGARHIERRREALVRPTERAHYEVQIFAADATTRIVVGNPGDALEQMRPLDALGSVLLVDALPGTVADHVLAIRAERHFDTQIPVTYALVSSEGSVSRSVKTMLPWR